MSWMHSFKDFIKYCCLIGGAISFANNSIAQQIDSLVFNKNRIENNSVWINSKNVNGLQYIPVKKVSLAELYFNKSNGGFKNYYGSEDSYSFGANTESYFRLTNKVVFHGYVNYNNFKGKNMQGSAFIDPYQSPLGFDENADTTAGNKKLESYGLSGAVSARLSKKLTLGARITYDVADYAKFKDLRHINSLLHMDNSIGATYQLNQQFSIGWVYDYIRRIESIKFETKGNKDQQYFVLINYGNFFGSIEFFDNGEYTEDKKPMVNNTHQGTLQVSAHLSPSVELLNEFSIGKRRGYYGKKGSASIVFTEHNSNLYGYAGSLSYRIHNNIHTFKLAGNYETLKNYKNDFRRETSTGGNSFIVYYAKNLILEQKILKGSFLYNGLIGIKDHNPLWEIASSMNFTNRYQKTSIYPYYRKQDINFYTIRAAVKRNVVNPKNILSFSIELEYGGGNGKQFNDGLYTTSASTDVILASRDAYLIQEYEFLTANKFSINPGIQYSFLYTTKISPYIKLGTNFTHAFDVKYLKKNYNTAILTIGSYF